MPDYRPSNPVATTPVTTLDYVHLARRGRPGMITAIGVLSIFVGCVSGVASLWGTLQGVGYFVMSQSAALRAPAVVGPRPAATTAPAATAPAPAAGTTVTYSVVAVSPGFGTATAATTTTAATAPATGAAPAAPAAAPV